MKKPMVYASALLIGVSVLSPLGARFVVCLPYRELFNRSDLVVIATPTARTADTKELSVLPGIVHQDSQGRQSTVLTIGVETPFKISLILKGEQTVEQIVLHHYREAISEPSTNAAMLLHFDPSDLSNHGSYLMFLIKDANGRYAPTGGQTDPGLNSVVRIPRDIAAASFNTAKP